MSLVCSPALLPFDSLYQRRARVHSIGCALDLGQEHTRFDFQLACSATVRLGADFCAGVAAGFPVAGFCFHDQEK